MIFDPAVIAQLTVKRRPRAWLRVTPLAFRATPLGLGYGKTRFASPDDSFQVLYIAPRLVTGVAETLVRDRYVARIRRRILEREVETWGVTEVEAGSDLHLLDLRTTGLVQLGAPTNVARGKNHRAGRRFSAEVYAQAPAVDGLLYSSRLTGGACIALYDRAVHKLVGAPVVELIRVAALVPALAALNLELVKTP